MVFYRKNKDGKKVLDKGQVAKGVLNAGKAISDMMRTAPAENDPGYISMKRDNAPERESDNELSKQNGSTSEYSVDAGGKGSLGPSKGNTYQGGTDTYGDYKKRRGY